MKKAYEICDVNKWTIIPVVEPSEAEGKDIKGMYRNCALDYFMQMWKYICISKSKTDS